MDVKGRVNAPLHLRRIRQLSCCMCLSPGPSDPHHLKRSMDRGMGMKAGDNWTVPLCRTCHERIEREGRKAEPHWMKSLAASLWIAQTELMMRAVLNEFRKGV